MDSKIERENVMDGEDSPKVNPITTGRDTSNMGGHR